MPKSVETTIYCPITLLMNVHRRTIPCEYGHKVLQPMSPVTIFHLSEEGLTENKGVPVCEDRASAAQIGVGDEFFLKYSKFALWVIWSGMARLTPREQYDSYTQDPRILFMEDSAYTHLMAPLREVAGLLPLNLKREADFSGLWILNEYESEIQNAGPSGVPYKMNIIQVEDMVAMEAYTQVEWAEDEVRKQLIRGDGSDMTSTFFNAPRIQNAHWSSAKDVLTVQSQVIFNFGGNPREITGEDVWKLERKGKQLIIEQTVNSFRGVSRSTLVYDKN